MANKVERRMVGALGLLAVATAIAHAQPDDAGVAAPRWRFTPIIGTDATVDLAAGLQVETPFRLRMTGTIGWMPRGYAWALKKYLETFYDVSDPVGNLVEDLVAGALVLRANVGYRLLPDRGLFAAIGYTFQRASKNGLIASQVEEATLLALPGGGAPTRLFDTTTHAHMIDLAVGWHWPLAYGFSIQATVGFLVIASTSTAFEPAFEPADPEALAGFIRVAEDVVDDAGQSTFAPMGTAFLGYTF